MDYGHDQSCIEASTRALWHAINAQADASASTT